MADLPAPELLEDLRRAYEEGLADPGFARFESLVRDAQRNPEVPPTRLARRLELTGDAVSEMEVAA